MIEYTVKCKSVEDGEIFLKLLEDWEMSTLEHVDGGEVPEMPLIEVRTDEISFLREENN